MRDAILFVLEDQVDVLAERLGHVEERVRRVMDLLTTEPVPNRLGLKSRDIALRCDLPIIMPGRAHHRRERDDRVALAEREAFRRRVAEAESLAQLSGQSFAVAWEATAEPGDRTPPPPLFGPVAIPETVWYRALSHIATTVSRLSFETWYRRTALVRDEGSELVVSVADPLQRSWLTTHQGDVVAEALAAIGRAETVVTFVEQDQEST